MKKLIVLILLIGSISGLKAQDLLVTTAGDSINCVFMKQKAGYVYFMVKSDQSNNLIKSLLPVSQVVTVKEGFYYTPAGNYGSLPVRDFDKIVIGVDGGWSRRIAKNPDGLGRGFETYLTDIKTGYSLGGSATYFFNEVNGVGLVYSLHRSQASIDLVGEDINGNRVSAELSDDISINFFGPSYTARFNNFDFSNAGYIRMAIGYVGYRDKVEFIESIEISASTLGLVLEFGYDFGISEDFALGIKAGFTTGYYEDYTVEASDGTTESLSSEEGEGDNLVRFDIGVGLRFRK